MKVKKRLDVLLTEQGYAENRTKAQAIIMSGMVYGDGQKADKPGTAYEETVSIEVRGAVCPYVSRGGLKLEKALRDFGVKPEGFVCSDSGASTGGFTDCLLQQGARKVFAIDVGYGQLDWKIRSDPRVVVMEKTNIRYVTPEQLGEPLDLSVVDVSFISLKIVLPAIQALLKPTGQGVVREKSTHVEVLRGFIELADSLGFRILGLTFSPVKGPEGNIEFLGHLSLDDVPGIRPDVVDVVEQAHAALDKGADL